MISEEYKSAYQQGYSDAKRDFRKKSKTDVLDEIRAEIMKLQTYKMFGGEDTVYVEYEDVSAIIDKYKAERMDT